MPLFFADLKVSVDLDQVGESELSGEAVGTTERLSGERGQVIDMVGPARSEKWLEQRILEDAGVEGVFKAMEHLLATSELVERRHPAILRGGQRHAVRRHLCDGNFAKRSLRQIWDSALSSSSARSNFTESN